MVLADIVVSLTCMISDAPLETIDSAAGAAIGRDRSSSSTGISMGTTKDGG